MLLAHLFDDDSWYLLCPVVIRVNGAGEEQQAAAKFLKHQDTTCTCSEHEHEQTALGPAGLSVGQATTQG